MIEDGRIQGLRIDHVDGLANPGGYCNLLVDRAAALGQPLYVVVEKILLEGERLRASWRIAGTTGYDFTNLLLGLFVDRAAERVFDRIYRRATARTTRFADEADAAKSRIMRLDLASELHVLADALTRIARSDRRSRDFTTTGLRNALAEVIRALPVYRTYVVDERIELEDRLVIENAVSEAAARTESPDEGIFSFIRDALSAQLHLLPGARYDRTAVIRFAMRFQQYTGPVTAKSVEDTAFYRYARLVALNEVGGEPARFGRSVAEFHAANAERARLHPHALLATATHDTKRGEDTRLRIAALSEFPAPWSRAIVRWGRLNAAARSPELDAPIPVDELLFYQTVLGTLPPPWLEDEPLDTGAHAAYVERLVAYARKAAREAKLRTSWTDPHQGYEAALEAFVRSTLQADGPFFREACALARLLAPVAAVHGLAQVALKLTAPGVPDIYQGCELWDFSLVDPDNRRPVDYAYRAALLADFAAHEDAEAFAAELLGSWTDGRIKLYLTWKLLRLRRERVATFMGSDYRELRIDGDEADAIVAFARGPVAVIAPRLVRARLENGTLRVRYPACRLRLETPLGAYRNVLDGRSLHADRVGTISIDDALAILPVAVLVPA
jgi:(1->4)-alpha-D-glucan 1-alpha-D-glucosylmutase